MTRKEPCIQCLCGKTVGLGPDFPEEYCLEINSRKRMGYILCPRCVRTIKIWNEDGGILCAFPWGDEDGN